MTTHGGVIRQDAAAVQVHRALRDAILSQEIAWGSRLIESDLALGFGVSRTPVREALGRLESEGLIERRRGKGLFVKDLRQEITSSYGLRERLEGYAAFLATTRITRERLAALAELCDERGAWSEDGAFDTVKRLAVSRRFHSLLLEAAESATLMRIEALVPSYGAHPGQPLGLFEYDDATVRRIFAEHSAIVEAMRRRDALLAEELARAHFRATVARLESQ